MSNRFKREIDLSPEDILAIVTLWENERQHANPNYRPSWQRFDTNYPMEPEKDPEQEQEQDEDWLDSPVYPHISEHVSSMQPNYYYDTKPQIYEKRGRWAGFSENKKKRFMVAKKRNDPTREIRYMNGPTRNDYYTLSELLGSQPEANLPLYQRYVL